MDALLRHQCMIYGGSPAQHVRGLAKVIAEKMQANHRCLYMNSPAMVAGIRSALAAAGINVAQEIAKRSLVLSSDTDHLVDGRFDVERMLTKLREAVQEALQEGYVGLWASGDMTWEFGNEQNLGKLLEYECGLEEMFRTQPAISGICQYHQDTLPEEALRVSMTRHPAIYMNETLTKVNPLYVSSDQVDDPRWSTERLKEILQTLRGDPTLAT
jgi:hypothetical protein